MTTRLQNQFENDPLTGGDPDSDFNKGMFTKSPATTEPAAQVEAIRARQQRRRATDAELLEAHQKELTKLAPTTEPVGGEAIPFSNYRMQYVAPTTPEHSFEPYCAIIADCSEFPASTVRVLDVPDPDESQRIFAQYTCDALNAYDRDQRVIRELREALGRVVAAFDKGDLVWLNLKVDSMYGAIGKARAALATAGEGEVRSETNR